MKDKENSKVHMDDWVNILNRATNISSMGVHIVDLSTREMYYSNDAGFKLIGQEPCDYTGRQCYEVFFGYDKPCDNCRLEETKLGATRHEVYVPEADMTFLTNAEVTSWNGKDVFVEYITDITSQKQSEEKQHQLLNQLDKVIHNVPGAICLYQWNGIKLEPLIVSKKYSEMLGADALHSLQDTEGIMFPHVHPDDLESLQRAVMDALTSTHKLDYTYRSVNENSGEYSWINAQANMIVEADGTNYIYVMYTDVSKQERLRQTEEALIMAQKANEAKTEFFSRMSHDMRTPMNGIMGLAELSEEETNMDTLKRNISKIKDSGQYLLSLINDTLDFQRIESGKLQLEPQVVNCRTILDSIVDMVKPAAAKKHIDFQILNRNVVLDWYILVDPVRMKQIFVNLLSNAVKFTPEEGKVSIEYECLYRKGMISHDRFIIRDTGIGMSKEFLENGIFRPFSQEQNQAAAQHIGSGLGLSIVHSLVELMGGTITVESSPNSGTTFVLEIDFERVNDAEVSVSNQTEMIQNRKAMHILNGKRILLAEDHHLNAEIARKLLEKANCEITWVRDGSECLTVFVQSKLYYFDAILMDIRMPFMNGLESANEIRFLDREDAKKIPIIALTANAYEEDIRQALESGMNAHISKPIEPSVMFGTIAGFLSET